MKFKIILSIKWLFINSLICFAQSAGPNSPTTAIAAGTGANFANLTGFYTPMDLSPAYTDLADFPTCTNQFNCFYSKAAQVSGSGFSIPVNATINGIEVKLRKQISNPIPNIKDSIVQLLKGGIPTGNNYSNSLQWPNLMTDVTYGDSTNLWGTSWTPADINSASFGVNIVVKNTDFNQLAQIDHASIKVFYSVPNGIENASVKSEPKLKVGNDFVSIVNAAAFTNASIEIYNLLGEKVKHIQNYAGEEISLSNLNQGVYVLQIRSSKGISSKRFFF